MDVKSNTLPLFESPLGVDPISSLNFGRVIKDLPSEQIDKNLNRKKVLDYFIARLDDLNEILVNTKNISYCLSFFDIDRNVVESFLEKIEEKFKIFNPMGSLAIKTAAFLTWKNAHQKVSAELENDEKIIYKHLKESNKELSHSFKKVIYFFVPFSMTYLKDHFSFFSGSIFFCATHLIFKDVFELYESVRKIISLESKINKTTEILEKNKQRNYQFFSTTLFLSKDPLVNRVFQTAVNILLTNKQFTLPKLHDMGILEVNEETTSRAMQLDDLIKYTEELLKKPQEIEAKKIKKFVNQLPPGIVDLNQHANIKNFNEKNAIALFITDAQRALQKELQQLLNPLFEKHIVHIKKKAEDTFTLILDKKIEANLQALRAEKKDYMIKLSFHVASIALSLFSHFVIFPLCPLTSPLFLTTKIIKSLICFNLTKNFTFILLIDSSSNYKTSKIIIYFNHFVKKIIELKKQKKLFLYTKKKLQLLTTTYLRIPLSKIKFFIFPKDHSNLFLDYLRKTFKIENFTPSDITDLEQKATHLQLELIDISHRLESKTLIQDLEDLEYFKIFPRINQKILADFELDLLLEDSDASMQQKFIDFLN